jgi:hypothetical protein
MSPHPNAVYTSPLPHTCYTPRPSNIMYTISKISVLDSRTYRSHVPLKSSCYVTTALYHKAHLLFIFECVILPRDTGGIMPRGFPLTSSTICYVCVCWVSVLCWWFN